MDFRKGSALGLALVSIVFTNTTNAAQFDLQWALENKGQRICADDGTNCSTGKVGADIKAKAAWTKSRDCSKVVVAVLDSGVDLKHPDLAPNLLQGRNFVPSTPTNNPQDDNLHGTHVTGIIAAAGTETNGVVGVCQKAQVLPVKVGDAEGFLADSDILEGIAFAVSKGAKLVNASFGGGPSSSIMKKAISDAKNTLFIVAAGNGDFLGRPMDIDRRPSYPAAYDLANIVGVAATSNLDALGSFSNFGAKRVHLAAPGVNILSTLPTVATREMRDFQIPVRQGMLDGTSMATPYVTGAAALLWSNSPSLKPADVKARLISSVDKITSLNKKVSSGGRLNLAKLMGVASR